MRWQVLTASTVMALLLSGIAFLDPPSVDAATTDLIRSSVTVDASITDHYSVTDVFATFNNPSESDTEASFSFSIPPGSMLSNLSLKDNGIITYASVAKKADADQRYDDAKDNNQTASKIEGTSSTNVFKIDLNVKGGSQVRVGLRFESMLIRTMGAYKFYLDLDSMDHYSDFEEAKGRITIRSTTNITKLMTEGSNMDITEAWTEKGTVALSFYRSNPSSGDNVSIVFREEQRPGTGMLKTYQDDTGGYFMHLFTPELETVGTHLPKDIIFVLDRSGSMSGTKIEQLKDAFDTIVHQLYEGDDFNLVIFNDDLSIYKTSMIKSNSDEMDSAASYMRGIEAGGSTDINNALTSALSNLEYQESSIPIVVFLTDGLPTAGITNTGTIRENVQAKNDGIGASIYTLGFGNDVDFEFLKALALENEGTAVQIPANADASSAMTGFYDTISMPLLMDIHFDYGVKTFEIIPSYIPGLYQGSEALVVGRYNTSLETIIAKVDAKDSQGKKTYMDSYPVDPESDMDMIPRIWAYRTIQDLTDRLTVDPGNESLVVGITELAMEYSFVTTYTSFILVVKQPAQDHKPSREGTVDYDRDGYADSSDNNPTNPTDPPGLVDSDKEGYSNDGGGDSRAHPAIQALEESAADSSILILFLIVLIMVIIFVGLVIFGIARANRNVLDQQNRKRIYDHIMTNPGDHFRSIQRAVDLEVGTLSHHINVLEKEQLIVSEQDGANRLFYPAGMKSRDDKVRLSRVQENILKSIRSTPGRTQSEIAKDLGVSRKIVFYHVQFLKDSGMVNEDQVGRFPRYYPN